MSYLAIARKYRPATFDEIVGQDHVTRTLRNAIDRGRIHHAFLFCGARGVGKTTAARALAKSLNCVDGPTADPCGVCTSCTEVAVGTSPDLIEIDGASNNSVDDIRDLRETVRYAPSQGRRKIYLVDEVHMLSKAAFNALLKTLEEPPPHVVFIFATTEPEKIPDTILSRVQRFDFKRIPASGVAGRLREIAIAEGATITDAGLKMIARAGEGSMRDSQSLLDKVISFSGNEISDEMVAETLGLIDPELLYGMLAGLVGGDAAVCLASIDRVYGFGFELSQFTSELLSTLRDATFLALSEETRQYVDLPEDAFERLDAIVKDVDPELLTRLFTAMMEVHEQVSRAGRPRIVLEMAIARLANVRPTQPLAALVARLEDMDRRLRQSGAARGRGGSNARQPRAPGLSRAAPKAHRAQPVQRPPARPRAARAPLPAKPAGPSAPEAAAHASDGPPAPTPPAVGPATAAPTVVCDSTPTADTTDDQRWSAFSAGLRALSPPATELATGIARRQDDSLIVVVAAGRPLATARRAARTPAVAELLTRCYPTGVLLQIETTAASGGAASKDTLEAEVLRHPTLQRVMRTFGAKLEDVVALDTENADE